MDKPIPVRCYQRGWYSAIVYSAVMATAWCIVSSSRALSEDDLAPRSNYGKPRRIAELANKEIVESSGIASSRRRSGLFWTHNDSGDQPRLFAFDKTGKDLGVCRLSGAEAIDWEDMSSYERNGKSWLLVGDVGDNGLRRVTYQLYLCEEPDPTMTEVAARRINFKYEHGSHNCEAVAVDAILGTVLLSTKIVGTSSEIYQLAIPAESSTETLIARQIATIPVGLTVAMDVSPDGLRAMVLTYGDAFEFSRAPDEDWQRGFSRQPRRIALPLRRQGESICYGPDGRSLFLTSEFSPTPLWEVPWVNGPSNPAQK